MADGDYFSVQSKEFEGNLKCFWQELQGENDFCDITLACEDKQLQTHKFVISKSSPVFRNILKLNQNPHPVIYLKGVKYIDLQNLLTFMYQGEANVAEADLSSFLEVAEDLQIKGLLNLIKDSNDSKEENISKSYPQDSAPSPKRKRVLANDNNFDNVCKISTREGKKEVANNEKNDQSLVSTTELSSCGQADGENNIENPINTETERLNKTTTNNKNNQDILDNMFSTVFSLGNNLENKEFNNIKTTVNKKEKKIVHGSESTLLQIQPWLVDLKSNFNTEIISVCSARTKSAVKNNQYIEDSREHDIVRKEIITNLMEKLMNILGWEVNAGLKAFRDLTIHLSYEYPEMFRTREPSQGRRGVDKIEIQARKMSDRYNKLRREEAKTKKI